jgi:hypothetical protein
VSSRKILRVMDEVAEIQEGGERKTQHGPRWESSIIRCDRHAHETVRDGSWQGLGSGGKPAEEGDEQVENTSTRTRLFCNRGI